ncbi:16.9 kDa class I heat shock protein 1 [Ziziphus jujuba]|uniref:16.9 kDa class I heat shock protein 1 n=1 Tax=Ziziphus jujuba TaxID=326968 RepID=A0ABM3ILA7_ZIZJJ|nr:16.9 kDa class I heat shock protein 1 [Ziziphus jujuba]
MASLGPWYGGNQGGWNDDVYSMWDPFILRHGGQSSSGQGHHRDETTTTIATANVDWRENDTAHIFRADLPGVKKEDLKVQVEDGNILQISGERSKEKKDKTDRWHRVERQCGSFVRRFRLPDNVDLDAIKCGLENGVLTVTVPKKEEMAEEESGRKNVINIDVAECKEDTPNVSRNNLDMNECM